MAKGRRKKNPYKFKSVTDFNRGRTVTRATGTKVKKIRVTKVF